MNFHPTTRWRRRWVQLKVFNISTVNKDDLDCPLVAGDSIGHKACLLHVSRGDTGQSAIWIINSIMNSCDTDVKHQSVKRLKVLIRAASNDFELSEVTLLLSRQRFPLDGERPTDRKLITLTCHFLFSTAKTHGGGENQQMAEDDEELGQVQEQWQGDFTETVLSLYHDTVRLLLEHRLLCVVYSQGHSGAFQLLSPSRLLSSSSSSSLSTSSFRDSLFFSSSSPVGCVLSARRGKRVTLEVSVVLFPSLASCWARLARGGRCNLSEFIPEKKSHNSKRVKL